MAKKQKDTKGAPEAHTLTETDFAQDVMGKNALQGEDQSSVRNQRHAVPNEKTEADDSIIETLEKSDKDIRAKRDLGKGRRHAPEHPYNKPK